MKKCSRLGFVWTAAFCLLSSLLGLTPAFTQASTKATIKRVALLGSEKGMELEIVANRPVPTDTRVLTGPDRVVIDFPGALPGNQLKGFLINHGAIRGVRVGLFESNPPITRVVLDLNAPTAYELFPSGNSVIVKLGSTAPAPVAAVAAVGQPIPVAAAPAVRHVQVSFQNGLLSIDADNASLAEVLYEVHLRTGAEIPIPAGAEREQVIVKAGPGPATDVMATVLNGSHFNFVVMGSDRDQNALARVILTPKDGADVPPPIPQPVAAAPVPEEVPSEVQPLEEYPENPPAAAGVPAPPMPPDQNAPPEPPPEPPQE
jgi:hypothetical protein